MGGVVTIIGHDTSLRGSYHSKNSLRVDGEIYGNVTSEDGIIVGEKGMIRGSVTGKAIFVGGKVKGNVTAYQRLELQSTAQIEGDVTTPILVIDDGAIFEGNCKMEEGGKVLELPKASKE